MSSDVLVSGPLAGILVSFSARAHATHLQVISRKRPNSNGNGLSSRRTWICTRGRWDHKRLLWPLPLDQILILGTIFWNSSQRDVSNVDGIRRHTSNKLQRISITMLIVTSSLIFIITKTTSMCDNDTILKNLEIVAVITLDGFSKLLTLLWKKEV